MNTAVVTLSLFLTLVATPLSVHGFSTGAPADACTTLTQQHGSNSPQTSTVPYTIDLSVFDDGAGGFVYVPGMSYQREENHNLYQDYSMFLDVTIIYMLYGISQLVSVLQ